LTEFVAFGQTSETDLELEMQRWREEKVLAGERQAQAFLKLTMRHEASIKNTHLRRERIINAAEGIACSVCLFIFLPSNDLARD
jgi:hypothetical protein